MSLPKVRLAPGDFAVLTLTEPWATLCALGEKSFETRSWPTAYRGILLIQAAKGMPTYAQQACVGEPFASTLARHRIVLPNCRPEDLGGARGQKQFHFAFGHIIAAVDLTDSARTERVADTLRRVGSERATQELAFGFYDTGRWAFRFEKQRRFAKPIPVRGALGIWTLKASDDATPLVQEQLVEASR